MADVLLKNVYKEYTEGVPVVQEFNLEIKDKEFIVFLGPSGCGKTTTLKMIAGLEEITRGEVYIDGKLVNDVAPKDRDIAMVFQSYALYPHLNVFENWPSACAPENIRSRKFKTVCSGRPNYSKSRIYSTGVPRYLPADSGSAWPWGAPSSETESVSDG